MQQARFSRTPRTINSDNEAIIRCMIDERARDALCDVLKTQAIDVTFAKGTFTSDRMSVRIICHPTKLAESPLITTSIKFRTGWSLDVEISLGVNRAGFAGGSSS